MSAKDIVEQQIPTKVKAKPEVAKSINAKVVFDLTGDGGGQWTLDLTNADGVVTTGTCEAPKVTLTMVATDFSAMVNGEMNAQKAFLTGKLKVKGDMGAALKLGQLLS